LAFDFSFFRVRQLAAVASSQWQNVRFGSSLLFFFLAAPGCVRSDAPTSAAALVANPRRALERVSGLVPSRLISVSNRVPSMSLPSLRVERFAWGGPHWPPILSDFSVFRCTGDIYERSRVSIIHDGTVTSIHASVFLGSSEGSLCGAYDRRICPLARPEEWFSVAAVRYAAERDN
jgi:hypothetical protein